MTFGEKMQLLRRAAGYTQEQFAEKCGVSRQSVAKWEADAALPEPERLAQISDLMRVTLDVLLREDLQPDSVRREQICGNLHLSDQKGLYTGILIKESLALEDILDAISVHKVELWRTESLPRYWTALYFSSDAANLPQRLSHALLPAKSGEASWFCDFRAGDTKYIVFHECILTYRIGDEQERARVVQECQRHGIPVEQTHWED